MNPARYQRHSLVDWFDQDKLSASSVLVIGAGAVGNEVLKSLCLLGVGRIHVVDFDSIEEHNLTRTILFTPADIGKNKAEVAALACRQIDPNVQVTSGTTDFWQSLSIEQLKHYDAALCCVDNFEARIRLNQMCLIARVDLFNAGIDSRNVSVEMYPFGTRNDCACYECWLPPGAYATMRQRYSCGGLKRLAFEERKIPTTVVTSSLAGACMTSLFLQRKCQHPGRLGGSTKFSLDTITLASSLSAISRFADCPACARFQPDCYTFSAKRHAIDTLPMGIAEETTTIFLSDPVLLETKCSLCGTTKEWRELPSTFDERLAICDTCRQHSNALRIVDSLPCAELATTFASKPLPVKFLYFHQGNRQFLCELED